YPFEVRGPRLNLRSMDGSRLSYCVLLGVTIFHAYNVAVAGLDPRHYFEDVVTECLGQRGLLAGNLGRERRKASDFGDAVYRIGEQCKLSPSIEDATVRTHAQEEGVDVIAHMYWGDSRPIHWVFVVQATCGKSDTWQRKLFESSEGMWKSILGLRVHPKAVLAVPHHIQPEFLRYLAEKGSGDKLVLDRLRLCSMNGMDLEGASQVCERLVDIEVEFE
ncbi:MAG TPA: hypothetical protein VIA62_12950, partial [Thermoanaerobaculia bacterium]|nr:hypothetical protein [Thermoanaerobaculia bacterium]